MTVIDKRCGSLSDSLIKALTRDLVRLAKRHGSETIENRLVMETRLDCSAPTLRV